MSLRLPTAAAQPSPFIAGGMPTMSSREIAELVESRHDSVKRTVERLVERRIISQPPLVDGPKSANGVATQEYLLGKRDSYIVVAQLSPAFTARLVDRWQELEARLVPALPDLNNPATLKALLLQSLDSTIELQSRVAALAPKADALDRLADTDGMILISDAAKQLQMQIKELFAWLRANRWIFRRGHSKRDIGHADKIRDGYLAHKYRSIVQGGETVLKEQVYLTPKGLTRLAEILGQKPEVS
ncbi:phage regulatory protein/antirepressor Ant [Tardiphaga sp. 20_F10_N6_6]|uniref:phage regulatory protein/antirepressor Ant n=1 Tax=Tardiphaga sp. 20_F10_N6_6 TaxID=3240788 RepID=UPI003F8A45EA